MKVKPMNLREGTEPVETHSVEFLVFQDPSGNYFVEVTRTSPQRKSSFWTGTYNDKAEAFREALQRLI